MQSGQENDLAFWDRLGQVPSCIHTIEQWEGDFHDNKVRSQLLRLHEERPAVLDNPDDFTFKLEQLADPGGDDSLVIRDEDSRLLLLTIRSQQ